MTMTAVFMFLGSVAGGYLLFIIFAKILPHLEKKENLAQRKEILGEANAQRDSILEGSQSQTHEHLNLLEEELESLLQQKQDDLALEEEELGAREKFYEGQTKRLEKIEEKVLKKSKSLEEVSQKLAEETEKQATAKLEVIQSLEKQAALNKDEVVSQMVHNSVEERSIEAQRILKFVGEEISSSARKRAQRVLDRSMARYAPAFIWPKSTSTLEVTQKTHGAVLAEPLNILEELKEQHLINSIYMPSEADPHKGHWRVAGGFGIAREALRATMETMLQQNGELRENKIADVFKQTYARLENEAVVLGKKAVDQLELVGIHPEIQKLVGALNWRTSYRQNQWYHTVEVAECAGIIAHELGVDPDSAKRVGLLHDIGKALDYRIEGSHAVISGDYADRYGESRLICDTVMSHHADLLVESPLAYVLRAADTLSGARPGARVNLEEGYQERISCINDVIHSFPGVQDMAIMNGGREVHIVVDEKKISENQVQDFAIQVARKIEQDVAFPGQIKVLVTRSFEAVSVA